MKLVQKAANDGEVPQMSPNPKVPQRRLAGLCLYAPAPQLPAWNMRRSPALPNCARRC